MKLLGPFLSRGGLSGSIFPILHYFANSRQHGALKKDCFDFLAPFDVNVRRKKLLQPLEKLKNKTYVLLVF